MLNINFDLFYELKQGSVISHTNGKVTKFWRVIDGALQTKSVIDKEAQNDWHVIEELSFPIDGKFIIENRFERFIND